MNITQPMKLIKEKLAEWLESLTDSSPLSVRHSGQYCVNIPAMGDRLAGEPVTKPLEYFTAIRVLKHFEIDN
jgi:hypothetical protein